MKMKICVIGLALAGLSMQAQASLTDLGFDLVDPAVIVAVDRAPNLERIVLQDRPGIDVERIAQEYEDITTANTPSLGGDSDPHWIVTGNPGSASGYLYDLWMNNSEAGGVIEVFRQPLPT